MLKSFVKITALILIVGLNWTGLSATGRTFAYFNDTENSPENIYQAGTLDFSLDSPQNNFGPRPEVAFNMMPGDSVTREIKVKNEGSLDSQYNIRTEKISGDDDLCSGLQLIAKLNGEIEYDGGLMDFEFSELLLFAESEDNWFFVAYLPYESDFVNKICQFKFIFDGWQDNVITYGDGGFSDTEEISSKLASWGVRINEVYYDVAANKGSEPKDEWLELYNQTNQDINVKDWTITDNDYSRTINANIEIPVGGFGVVSKDASTWAPGTGYWTLPAGAIKIILGQNIGSGLANSGDRLILSRPDGAEIDAMSYGNDITVFILPGVAEGHSLARRIAGYDTNQASDWEDLAAPNPGTNPHLISDEEIVIEEFTISEEELVEEELTEEISDEPVTGEETITTDENTQEEVTFDEVFNEIVNEDITVDLPDIDIIETTTPSDEPVFEEPGVEEGAKLLQEESEPESVIEEQPANIPDNDSGQAGDTGDDSRSDPEATETGSLEAV